MLLRSFAIAALSATCLVAVAEARQFTIETGSTEPLRLNNDAGSVVVGNPNIADVAVLNERTLLITGKSFGTTNLIVFDPDGKTLYSGDIVVTTNTANFVTINKAGENFTFDCSTNCRPAAQIGDNEEHYTNAIRQTRQQAEMSE